MQMEIRNLYSKDKIKIKEYGLYKDWKKFVKERVIKTNNRESRKIEILMEEILKVVKRTDNKL